MGLDTTHGCWHGPYSAFMRWREWLNLYIALDRMEGDQRWVPVRNAGATREALENAWILGLYNDQSDALNVLMAHSDCDGEIPAEICGPLADALQSIVDRRMDRSGLYDEKRPATERFIAGLRRASAEGKPVEFH